MTTNAGVPKPPAALAESVQAALGMAGATWRGLIPFEIAESEPSGLTLRLCVCGRWFSACPCVPSAANRREAYQCYYVEWPEGIDLDQGSTIANALQEAGRQG